jgi:hypothetical protein
MGTKISTPEKFFPPQHVKYYIKDEEFMPAILLELGHSIPDVDDKLSRVINEILLKCFFSDKNGKINSTMQNSNTFDPLTFITFDYTENRNNRDNIRQCICTSHIPSELKILNKKQPEWWITHNVYFSTSKKIDDKIDKFICGNIYLHRECVNQALRWLGQHYIVYSKIHNSIAYLSNVEIIETNIDGVRKQIAKKLDIEGNNITF